MQISSILFDIVHVPFDVLFKIYQHVSLNVDFFRISLSMFDINNQQMVCCVCIIVNCGTGTVRHRFQSLGTYRYT